MDRNPKTMRAMRALITILATLGNRVLGHSIRLERTRRDARLLRGDEDARGIGGWGF